MEVLILCWNIIVFVFTVTKCAILTITKIVKVAFRIYGGVKLTTSRNALNFFALKCSNFGGFETSDICAMTQWTSGVHEQIKEHSSVFTPIPEGVNLSILIKDECMFFTTDNIFCFNVIFFKILNKLRCLKFILMAETALTMVIVTDGIDFTSLTDDDGMAGTDCHFKSLFRKVELFRKGVFFPKEEFTGLKAEFVKDFSG